MNKTLKILTALFGSLALIIWLLFHSVLGVVIILEEFDNEYQIFIKKQFSTQAIFYHWQGMTDLDSSEIHENDFQQIVEYCEMRAYPHWRCPMEAIYQAQQKRNLPNKYLILQ